MVEGGPVIAANISILREVLVCLRVLVCPLFGAQLLLEEVRIKNDRSSEQVGKVGWLASLLLRQVFSE